MPTLGEVVGALLRDVVHARSSADRFSAALSQQYLKDDILSNFPVPRIDINEITLNLRFAIVDVGKDLKHAEVIVQAEKLKDLKEEVVSSISIVTGMKNYSWVRSDLAGKKANLVEVD